MEERLVRVRQEGHKLVALQKPELRKGTGFEKIKSGERISVNDYNAL